MHLLKLSLFSLLAAFGLSADANTNQETTGQAPIFSAT
jgi:hypothetical protein